ncbi:MAG TPA: SCO1664 family protein [Acidimicrobiales bacterium]|nr:SCO1664 family protein [Acidimicrobiales bacterium]
MTAADRLLREGEVEIEGRMPWSSNATLLVTVRLDDEEGRAVYKPHRGERPLWDFPSGLYQREVAAFELADWLGWDLVPPTVIRTDAPLGAGSLQQFVDADFEQHYFTLYEDASCHDTLRRLCLFDLLANSTDRKSGHCLLAPDGRILAIDNGLSFHREFKLRTVIWEFGGEPIPDDLLDDVRRLDDDGPPPALVPLLDPFELDALAARARAVLADPHFPVDPTGRRYPWPLV